MPATKMKRVIKAKKASTGEKAKLLLKVKLAAKKIEAKIAKIKKELTSKLEKAKKEAFAKGLIAGSKRQVVKKAKTARKVKAVKTGVVKAGIKRRGRPARKS